LWFRFYANMSGSYSDTSDYFYIDDISILRDPPYFYFDDVSITEGDSFYADNLWIGAEYNSNTIEIAYTRELLGDAYLDRIGVWMPPGCHYVGMVGNETSVDLRQELSPTILPNTYAEGTIVEWDYGNVNLSDPVGGGFGETPIVRTLTFTYQLDVAQKVEGMFIWIKAHGGSGQTYISWDKGYEIYKAVSQAHSEIYGTNTQVTAYAAQGEIDKKGAAVYGDYVAVGNPLLIDVDDDALLAVEYEVNPAVPLTWKLEDGIFYDGRDEIGGASIPDDAEIVAGWLYWSAYVKDSSWSAPDENVSFMYPKRYGSETFDVHSGNGNDSHITGAWSTRTESMDLLAHDPVLTLSQVRYVGEVLGNATAGHGNDTFWTAHPYIKSPAPIVRVAEVEVQSSNYTIDYATGNVTIINDALSGRVTIDYWASGSMTLLKGTDYAITQSTLDYDVRYTGFTVGNDNLEGTVTIDYYYAKHWENVTHAAYDKYGTELDPVAAHSRVGASGSYVGWAYACFRDVTDLLTANGTDEEVTGRGQYAVTDVLATPGANSYDYRDWCYSGWSLIVLYESPSETAHQFYLYDPIHNPYDPILHPDGVPFMMTQFDAPNFHDVGFTLKDFYPPEGTVDGRTTCFVGEGDDDIPEDYFGFKGASQPSYTNLSGINNPVSNVMNSISTGGERGVDIDTYTISGISGWVATDTKANIRLRTQVDVWYLVYMILSFKTNEVPKSDFAFNVASVTYQYELGGN
jgi:hypothetical protein